MISLRDYQTELLDRTRQSFREGNRRVLLVSPTGSGKTRTGSGLIEGAVAKGKRLWWINHRRELVKQSYLAFVELGLPAAICAAGFAENRNAPVQVCSIDTLRTRHSRLPRPDLIIFDEAHHIAANTWHGIANRYPEAAHLGLTATPTRLDGTGLHHFFDDMIIGPTVPDLIRRKWLSPYVLFGPKPPDLSGIHTLAGDYNKKEVAERMKTTSVCGGVIQHYQKYVPGKQAIAFMWSVDASIEMAQRLNEAGIPAAHIDGGTDSQHRDAIIEQFRAGRIKVLTNYEIVGEGFDIPNCEAGFFCRPTQSLTLYLQQMGRVFRPGQGKIAHLFDHVGNYLKLGLPDDVHEWSLDDGDIGRKKRKKDAASTVRVCPKCEMVHAASVRICDCGYVLVEAREMDVDEEAELTVLDPEQVRCQRRLEQGKADSLEKLIAYGRAKNMRFPELWARHVARAREEKKTAKQRQANLLTQPAVEIDERWTF